MICSKRTESLYIDDKSVYQTYSALTVGKVIERKSANDYLFLMHNKQEECEQMHIHIQNTDEIYEVGKEYKIVIKEY